MYSQETVEINTDPSKAEQLAVVQQNGFKIIQFKNPSNAVQLAAIQQNRYSFLYFKDNAGEAAQLAAVQQKGYFLKYCKNPNEAIQLAAVQQDKHAIQYCNKLYSTVIDYLSTSRYKFLFIAISTDKYCQLVSILNDKYNYLDIVPII
jgi:hypothetical protein